LANWKAQWGIFAPGKIAAANTMRNLCVPWVACLSGNFPRTTPIHFRYFFVFAKISHTPNAVIRISHHR